MLEKKQKPVISKTAFAQRMAIWLFGTLILFAVSLVAGMAGYHYYENLSWVDSFLNASMILGGMGEVDQLHTSGGKIFAGCYAIYSGLLLVICGGLLLVPVFHRVLHHFHSDR